MLQSLLESIASQTNLPLATVTTAAMLLAKTTMLLLFAWFVTAVMQRMSAVSRHTVWFVSLVALLAVPAVALFSPWQLPILPATLTSAVAPSADVPLSSRAPDNDVARAQLVLSAAEPNLLTDDATPATGAARPWFSDLSVGQLLLLAWAIVAAALAAWLVLGLAMLARITRRATVVTDAEWTSTVYEIADRLDLQDAPRLLRSTDILMPFACGLRAPTIVLPASSAEWSAPQRAAVLLHEMAHIKRRDIVGHTVGRLVCALYWFHPMVWSAAKRLRSESERACDDLALLSGARASEYAEHLLDIVSSVRRNTTPSAAMAMATRSEFEGRMLAILDATLSRGAPSRRQTMSLVTSAAALVVVVGAASPATSQPPRATSRGASPVKQPPTSGTTSSVTSSPAAMSNADRVDSVMHIGDVSVHVDPVSKQVRVQSGGTTTTTRLRDAESRDSLGVQRSIDRELSKLGRSGEEFGASFGAAMLSLANLGIKAASDEMARVKLAPHTSPKDTAERVELLLNVLRNEQRSDIRRVAVWGLAEYSAQRAVAEMLATTLRKDAEASVREMAAWSLAYGSKSSSTTAALVVAARDDRSELVQQTAIWALVEANAGDTPTVIAALTSALSANSARVREVAAWALGSISPAKAPSALVKSLTDADATVRESAAWALHEIADASTVSALSDALRTERIAAVQLAEMRALGVHGDAGVSAISRLIDSRDEAVRAMAVRILASGEMGMPWPRPRPLPRPIP